MKLKLQKPPPAAGGEILKSGPHDVLCGRGNRINGYKGNRLFQQVVKRTRIEYVAVAKSDKRAFATHLVRAINALDPPGRFLKTEEVNGKFKYVEMDEKAAVVKSRQALREGAPEIEKSIKEGVIKPRTGDMVLLVREEVHKVYQTNNYVNAQDQIYRSREAIHAKHTTYANHQQELEHVVLTKKEAAALVDNKKHGASTAETNLSARQMSPPQALPSPSCSLQTDNALKEEKKQGEDQLSLLILGGGYDLPALQQQLVDKRRILQQAIQLQEDHSNRILAAQAYRELQFQLLKNNHILDPVALNNVLERNVMMDNKLSAQKCRLERAREFLMQRDQDSFQKSANPKIDGLALEPDQLTVNNTSSASVDDKDKILAAVSLCSLFSSTKSEKKVKNEENIHEHSNSNCVKPGQEPPVSTSSNDIDSVPSRSPFSKRSREIEQSDSLDQSLNESLEQNFSSSPIRKKMKVHGSVPLGQDQDAVIGQSDARNDSSVSKRSEEHRSVAPIVQGFYLQNGSQGLVSVSEVQNPRITIKTEIYFHPPN